MDIDKTLSSLYIDIQTELKKKYYDGFNIVYQHEIAKLYTETITENICSIITDIFGKKRQRLLVDRIRDLLRSRLILPFDFTKRDKVIEECVNDYIQKYENGNMHFIINEYYKRKRKAKVSNLLITEQIILSQLVIRCNIIVFSFLFYCNLFGLFKLKICVYI